MAISYCLEKKIKNNNNCCSIIMNIYINNYVIIIEDVYQYKVNILLYKWMANNVKFFKINIHKKQLIYIVEII